MSLNQVENGVAPGELETIATGRASPPIHPSGSPRTSDRRIEIYRGPHKGLRFLLANLLLKMGTTSFASAREAEAVITDLEVVLWVCDGHIAHEDAHIRPALVQRAPSAVSTLDAEHVEHARQVAELRSLAAALADATPTDTRRAIGDTLLLQYSVFVAETLAHMAYEERVVQPLLDRLFSAEELISIHEEIVGSVPPHEMIVYLRGMIPGANKEERAEMLGNIRAHAPREGFALLLSELRTLLSAGDWRDLESRLAL